MDTPKLPGAALQEQIAADLAARGYANAEIAELTVTVDLWRQIARRAARTLGRPVQTLMVGERVVTAVLRDWPATPAEQAVHDAALRAAMNQLPPIVAPRTSGRAAKLEPPN